MIFGAKEKFSADHINLVTDHLILRPARLSDAAAWIKNREKNRGFLEPFEPQWPQDSLTKDFFKKRVERLADDIAYDRSYTFLIFEKNNLDLIGGINLNNIARGAAQHASLGYWLCHDWQGRGLMTSAARAVLGFAFFEIRLKRVNAATLPHNQKSRDLLMRLGFKEEGFAKAYIQINGVREDHVLYGLNVDEFETGYSGAA